MDTYKVAIKAVNSDHVLHTSITTDEDLDYVRSVFGLAGHDVEWYTIEKCNELKQHRQ